MGTKGALILGSAPFGDGRFLRPYLAAGEWMVLCADGGIRNARAAGLKPDLLIGDWDSGGAPDPDVPCITLPALGCRELLLCGCTGGRLDHTASNLVLLEWIARRGGRALLLDPDNEVRFLAGGRLLLENRPPYRYLSVIPLDETVENVTLRQVKYPLEHAVLTRGDTLSVSNEPRGGVQEIITGSGRALLIRSGRLDTP